MTREEKIAVVAAATMPASRPAIEAMSDAALDAKVARLAQGAKRLREAYALAETLPDED
jgi:hypothetical protein